MSQEEKDLLLEKIDSIYGKAVKASWDYMASYDFNDVVVVTNRNEHPELYNY